jgi:hypothetical protein
MRGEGGGERYGTALERERRWLIRPAVGLSREGRERAVKGGEIGAAANDSGPRPKRLFSLSRIEREAPRKRARAEVGRALRNGGGEGRGVGRSCGEGTGGGEKERVVGGGMWS